LTPYQTWLRSIAPISSTLTALIVTPLVSLLTPPNHRASAGQIWLAYRAGGVSRQPGDTHAADAALEATADTFHLIPTSFVGRAGAVIALAGLVVFLAGVCSAAGAFPLAGELAIGGMIAVFVGGLVRVYVE
jgi:hypothetical protein